MKSLSRVLLLATTWTAAYQPPASKGFSKQEYWSRVPLPSPREHLSGEKGLGTVNRDADGSWHPCPWCGGAEGRVGGDFLFE